MKTAIRYIELKTDYSDNGPAWIGLVSFSKSGKTIYFDDKALQSLKGSAHYANYFDLESGEEYWISGVKKNMTDRHWAGGGKIQVERRILKEYLQLLDLAELPRGQFELVDVKIEKAAPRIYDLENEIGDTKEFDDSLFFKQAQDLSLEELAIVIERLILSEQSASFNKRRRAIKQKRHLLEEELENRNRTLKL